QLDRVPAGEVVPEWFKSVVFAIHIKEWHLTTGTTILKEEKGKASAGNRLVADLEPGDDPVATGKTEGTGLMLGETIPSESMKVMEKSVYTTRRMKDAKARGATTKGARRPTGKNTPAEGLLVISNRGRETKESGTIIKRTENSILESLFHELAAHAGPSSQGKDSEHAPGTDWHVAPINAADETAKKIYEFFGKPKEVLKSIPPDTIWAELRKTVVPPKESIWQRARRVKAN